VKRGTLWNRLAAATGIDFVVAGVVIAIIAQNKGFENAEDWVGASDNLWALYVLLLGLAGAFFMWFTSIFVARLRQVEDVSGTSGRLARAQQMAGSVIAANIALAVGVQWAARMLGATEIAPLSTALLEGPTMAFPIAAYIGAAGIAVTRAGPGAPSSRITAYASVLIAPFYLVLAAIQVFKNYAWIDETGYFVFLAWVLVVSAQGVQRWASIDSGWTPSRRFAPPSMMSSAARYEAARARGLPPPPTSAPTPPPTSRPTPQPTTGPMPAPSPLPGPAREVTSSAPTERPKPAPRRAPSKAKPASKRKPAPKKDSE
jgi:hypothetical protein